VKVLYYNNFSTAILWREWQAGMSPEHHLWGVPGLQNRGLQVDVLPYEGTEWLKRISKRLKLLGDLDQQLRVLRVASQYDVIYCGCQHDALFLGVLKACGLLKTPVVVTMHHMVNPMFRSQSMFRLFFGRINSFVCLHKRVASELLDRFGVPPGRVDVIEWGGDAAFYARSLKSDAASGQLVAGGRGVVAAGRTFRDYGVLIRATRDTDLPVNIYCTPDALPDEALSPNIHIHSQADLLTLKALLGAYRDAAVVAIPMIDLPDKLIGLTSLVDAMGMGKPVVMTRNAHIDIDIEKEGIGLWVDAGDVEGWKKALGRLLADPDTCRAMGQRALALINGPYHIDRFAGQLAEHLNRTVEHGQV